MRRAFDDLYARSFVTARDPENHVLLTDPTAGFERSNLYVPRRLGFAGDHDSPAPDQAHDEAFGQRVSPHDRFVNPNAGFGQDPDRGRLVQLQVDCRVLMRQDRVSLAHAPALAQGHSLFRIARHAFGSARELGDRERLWFLDQLRQIEHVSVHHPERCDKHSHPENELPQSRIPEAPAHEDQEGDRQHGQLLYVKACLRFLLSAREWLVPVGLRHARLRLRGRVPQAQVLDQLRARLVTLARVFGQCLVDDATHDIGQIRLYRPRIGSGLARVLDQDRDCTRGAERQLAREHLIEHHAQRVDV